MEVFWSLGTGLQAGNQQMILILKALQIHLRSILVGEWISCTFAKIGLGCEDVQSIGHGKIQMCSHWAFKT